MSTNWRVPHGGMAIFLIAVLAWASAAATRAATDSTGASAPVVRLEAVVDSQTVRFEAESTGALEFVTHRPTERLFVVDFAGQAPASSSYAQVLDSALVSSYRILQHRGGAQPIVRLEVLLRQPLEPHVERRGENALTVVFGMQNSAAAATVTKAASAAELAAAPATAIRNVVVSQVEGRTQVRVEGNGKLAYRTMRLSNPDRLVLDFENTRAHVARRLIPGGHKPVESVRVGQFKENVTRVVINLDSRSAYEVTAEDSRLTVVFGATAATRVPEHPLTAGVAHPAPASTGSTVQPMVAPEITGMDARNLPLPAFLTQPTAALASLQHVAAPPAEPTKAERHGSAEAQTGAGEPATASPAAAQPSAASVVPGQYTGEPISVNLKDVDLKDFFRLIHEISGLNVVLDPNISGSLTIVLDDVPWDQALDIVLRNNNLDKQLEGNVLRIATRETLKKEAEMLRDLQRAQAEAVEPVTTTRVLSYAKASSIRDTLKRFLSSRGEILSDDRSNMLIIRDIPSVLPTMDNLIAQLDQKSQQVEIEARVVAATRQFSREIGTQFGFATTAAGGRTLFGGVLGSDEFTSPVSRGPGLPPPPLVVGDTEGQIPLNTNLGARTPTSGFTFAHASPNLALDFIITAAESRGVGKLLSKPKVMTQNNEKAEVKQGTKIPVQTIINNTITVQFIDAVLKLEVTPQITAEGTIFMDVLVENTAIDPGIERIQGIPALTTQATSTKITVPDGGTFVIGGVIISSQRTDIAQVPLFGSIPVIGHLFKRTTVSTQSQELLFFITPRIIPN